MTTPDPKAVEEALADADKIVAGIPPEKWKVCEKQQVVLAREVISLRSQLREAKAQTWTEAAEILMMVGKIESGSLLGLSLDFARKATAIREGR